MDDRLQDTAANFAAGFLLAFVVGWLFRDRRTGVRAGIVYGLLSAVLANLAYDSFVGNKLLEEIETRMDERAARREEERAAEQPVDPASA